MLQVKERRHPWRRLTTSHSRKTGRPHRLSPPVFFLTPPPARKRTEGPISLRLRKTCPTRRGDILVPLFSTVAFAGPRWGRSWADRRGDFQSPRGSGGRKTPTPSKTWGTLGGGTFLSPSSPQLLSLVSGGAGVRRIGGGTFSPPVGVGVGKPPLLFTQDFAGPGPVGGVPKKSPKTSSRRASSTPNARKRAPRMTPLQTSTGVFPGTDRDGRRSGVLPGADWEGRPERRVSRADWDRRLLGAAPPGRVRGDRKVPPPSTRTK